MSTLTTPTTTITTTTTTTTNAISVINASLFLASCHSRCRKFSLSVNHFRPHRRLFSPIHVAKDVNKTEVSRDRWAERSDADKLVDGMDFGELCNDFECISSPQVESTARRLARDILELREGNRAFNTFAVSVKYKAVQEMEMMSTSVLIIKWTVKGKPKSILAIIGGELIIKVDSKFTLNQISGQVLEHEETWDLSASSVIAQAYFWTSRRLFATKEAGKDMVDSVKDLSSKFSAPKENGDMYPDPSGDPTKFFQRDDSFQRDVYQIALFFAVAYFVIQFLKITL